jgi:anti-sigma-K factor RskA
MPFHVVILHDASNPQDDFNGMLVISDDGQFGTLITDNLKVLTAQSNYQLWLVKDGTRTSGGVFSVNDAGYGWLKITSKTSLLSYQSFGVTVEPAGGSMAPTGLKVLGGNQ